MTNLGGHDMESVLEAFEGATGDRPTCFPRLHHQGLRASFAGHKDNHAGLMSPDEMEAMRASHGVRRVKNGSRCRAGRSGGDMRRFLAGVPFNQGCRAGRARRRFGAGGGDARPAASCDHLDPGTFGRVLDTIARAGGPLADRIVPTSPDVTVSTNLGGW